MLLSILTPGYRISFSGGRIQVSYPDGKTNSFPSRQVTRLVVLNGTPVSPALITDLIRRDGKILYLNKWGKLKAQIQPLRQTGAVTVRLAQYDQFRDPAFSLDLAKATVRSKIGNMQRLLREREVTFPAQYTLAMYRQAVERVTDKRALLGIEGSAAREYFAALRECLPAPYCWPRRIKRGATDPVNQTLNFLYSLLRATLAASVVAADLDPFFGYLHDTQHSHQALVSDCMELFRAQVADRIMLKAFNDREFLQILESETAADESRLPPDAVRWLLASYHARLQKKITAGDVRMNFLEIMHQQARQLRAVIMDKSEKWTPWQAA